MKQWLKKQEWLDKPMTLRGRIGVFIVCAFMIFSVMSQVLKPEIEETPEIRAYLEKLQYIPASEILQKIEKKDKKLTFLFVYASWCGYCKRTLPALVELMQTEQLANTKVLFFALDEDPKMLAAYLTPRGYDQFVSPYALKDYDVLSLKTEIKKLGGTFEGAIPYLALFNAEGKLLDEHQGVINKADIVAAVQHFR